MKMDVRGAVMTAGALIAIAATSGLASAGTVRGTQSDERTIQAPLVLIAEGGRGAGQSTPGGTGPGSGMGATGGTGKGSPGGTGPGSGTGSTGGTSSPGTKGSGTGASGSMGGG